MLCIALCELSSFIVCKIHIEIKYNFELSQVMTKPISDHKQLIASLSDDQRSGLTQKSDFLGGFYFISHIVAITLTSIWIINGLSGWQAIMFLQGAMLVFLFTLLHETVHFTVFKRDKLNTSAGWLCSIVIFLPPNWFRYFHLAHHRHTHDPEKDPELEGAKPETLPQFLWAVSGLPVWWFHLKTICANAFTNPTYDYVPKGGYVKIKSEARMMLGLYSLVVFASIYFSSNILIWVWLLPMLLGQPFLRLYLMAEHGRCPHVANMLENTRTTYTISFVRWLAWNMPYHTEHHAYPSVPFHKLPRFHEVAKEHLQVTENGYTQFHKKTVQIMSGAKEQA